MKFNDKEIQWNVSATNIAAVAHIEGEGDICTFLFVADVQDPDGHWQGTFAGRFADVSWKSQVSRFRVLSEGVIAMEQALKEHESTMQRIDTAEAHARQELNGLSAQ